MTSVQTERNLQTNYLRLSFIPIGSASQLSFTSSNQQTSESSALYKTDATHSELASGAAFSTGGLGGEGGVNGCSTGADGKTIFISKTTIPRVERSNSNGTTEKTYEKSSESRLGNGMTYTISYQHSTVRNVSSTLPRKQPTYNSTTSYSQVIIYIEYYYDND